MWKTAPAALVAALAVAGAAAAPQTEPLIAFADTRTDFELLLKQTDGTDLGRVASSLRNEQNPSLSPDGRWVAFESKGVFVARLDGSDVRRLGPADSTAVEPAWSPDGRRIAWSSSREGNPELYAAAPDGSGLERLTNDPAPDRSPAWSPGARRLAFARGGVLYELDPDRPMSARALARTPDGAVASPAWSPDGSMVAMDVVAGGRAAGVVYLARLEPGVVVDAKPHVVGSDPGWSDDGRVLFVRLGALWSIRADRSEVRRIMPLRPNRGHDALVAGWSQAGDVVAYGWDVGSRPQLYAARPDGTRLRRLFEPAAVAPSFSPGGSRIAFFAPGPRRATLVVAAVAARRLARVPLRADPSPPTWSPNGRRLAFETRDGVFTIRSAGSRPTRLRGTTRADGQPDWSPDGRSVVFTRRVRGRPSLHVVDLRTGRSRLLRRDAETAAWSPDGRRLAFANRYAPPYNVDVWVVRRDGTHPRRLTRHPDFDTRPEWSLDGRRIAFISSRGTDTAPWLGSFRIFVMRADRGERTARPVAAITATSAGTISWGRG